MSRHTPLSYSTQDDKTLWTPQLGPQLDAVERKLHLQGNCVGLGNRHHSGGHNGQRTRDTPIKSSVGTPRIPEHPQL